MPKKPTAEDAKIIMRLYDLRREPEMRKARTWYAGWWPRSADEIVQMVTSPANPQENAWFRQVNGYWDMAASFVTRGVLNEDLFFDNCAEMWFILSKLHPFLKEVRAKAGIPKGFARVEKLATRTKAGRERLETSLKRAEARRSAASAKA